MFDMTEALIHHALFCVLTLTNATIAEIRREQQLAEAFAFHAGRDSFTTKITMPHYFPSILAEEWKSGYGDAEDQHDFEERCAEFKLQYPDSPVSRTLYCPSGHNQVDTKSGYEECGACGAVMTEDSEESYYDSLIACGQCM
ncbi:hypothetical protein HAP94_19505 [Acidithiobacillus ferrivorans]|nr:hypothetical protein [Acidithiobacillus ferrivorans]